MDMCRFLGALLILGGLATFSRAQDQRFYFPNQQQNRFVQTFQSPENGYFPQVTSFRSNTPGYHADLFEGDLQTSDLPPHLAQTLPQYQFTRFAQPAVQNPVPFQLPSKSSIQDTYLYDDDSSSRNVNLQVPRPQPFQPASKSKLKQQPHSHYLTSSHKHDPSQTETFLGQITLQSPDLHPDFNPDIPALRPSKEYPFQPSHSLVDQFSPGRRPQNVPLLSRPSRPRINNRPFKELSETVDQHLEDFLEHENNSNEEVTIRRPKPSIATVDRPSSNSVQSNSNYSSRFRTAPASSTRANKSRSAVNNYWVNSNGDVIATTRHGFSPKVTSTYAPTTAPERRNRFHPTTKSPTRPLAFHLKNNKIPFNPRRTTSTSTTENNNFDLESLLEDPIDNHGEHFEHDDDVEIIQSIATTSTVPPTTETESETEESTVLTTDSYNNELGTADGEDDNASTESKDVKTVEYSNETYTSTSNAATEDIKPTDPLTLETTEHKDESESDYEYYDEYETTTYLPHVTTVTDDSDIITDEHTSTNNEDENKTSSETVTYNSVTTEASTTDLPTSNPNFDVLTVKPARIVEGDNFNHFVDTGIIDNNSEELDNSPEPYTSERSIPDAETTEQTPTTTDTSKVNNPVLIGEAVVSVVTTKSVINGTFSVPTSAPQVTEQMNPPETVNDTASESWMVVASVQTSRSVSGARYLSFPMSNDDSRAKLLNEQPQDSSETDTESNVQDSTSESPIVKSGPSSTESISDKLDRVQSELSSGFLSGGFRNSISVITEQSPEKTTLLPTTTTQKPSTISNPVVIRKFSPNLRPSTTERARKKLPVFDTIRQDDLTGLLPPGFKPKYQNTRTTTTTEAAVDLDLPQGDEPVVPTELKNKIKIQDDVSSFLPPGYKVPKETDLPKDPVKTLEGFLGKVRNQANNKTRNNTKLETKSADINDGNTTDPNKSIESLLIKAEPVDISAFLPPGFKLTTTEKPKIISSVLAKAEPVDISAFLPPGYKAPKPQNITKEKPKGPSGLLAEAIPLDVSAFLPPGYKGRFSTSKPRTESTQEASTTKVEISSTVASTTTTSGGSKVVFPTRPGGRKPIHRLTTPRQQHNVEGPGPTATSPIIQKGWPSRATTEFTGWPTPSTTPISIEKLLEAARTATSASSSSEYPTDPTSTTTTTTTTTTTQASTTPGICVGECDLAGTIKLVGGASWVPELLDHNTKEWQILANEVQTQLERAYSKSAVLNRWYRKIRIDEFSPGSVLVDYTVELTDLGRKVDTMELKSLFNEALNAAPAASARSIGKSESIRDRNTTKLALGPYVLDPAYTDFIVLSKNIGPTVGYAEDNVFLPQWAIAVIVIGLASLLFVIIFGVTVLVNRQKNAKKKQPTPLTEEMLNELNKNHMGGLDNYGADDLYNMEDVWNDKAYDVKPPKKRSSGSIHDNSMSNLYDSWRSEWNGYYYNAYYGNNAGGSSNGGFQRRRSDYDTNF